MVKGNPKKLTNWKPVQLPKELVNDLETFANAGLARSLGFTNKSQLAAFAIRDFLAKYSEYLETYQLVDYSEDKITLIDHGANQVVTIKHDGKFLRCDVDNESYCEHIKFVLLCPAVLKVVKKFGYPNEENI